MKTAELLFLNICRNALNDQRSELPVNLSCRDIQDVIHLSHIHNILPLVADSIFNDPTVKQYASLHKMIIDRSVRDTSRQAQRTGDFLLLYDFLNNKNLYPVVMKGIICRSCYPKPELRASVDEDLLIDPEQIGLYDEALKQYGFSRVPEDSNIWTQDEITYENIRIHLTIEVHKFPFVRNSSAYSNLNNLFTDHEPFLIQKIYWKDVQTFGYTDHVLYLICHAFKHFLYSGVGIRQLCDITIFSNTFGRWINWDSVYEACQKCNIDVFCAAIFKICQDYLGMQAYHTKFSELTEDLDIFPLLEDILSGGVYGIADVNRLHSSTLTLRAVSSGKSGKKPDGLSKALFPDRSYMENNYPYLKKHSYLLPLAWTQRIYSFLTSSSKNIKPGKTLEIGKQRIDLLKKYKILE